MPKAKQTFRLVEYGQPDQIVGDIAVCLGCTRGEAEQQLRRLGERLQAQHSLALNPIEITEKGVSVKGIAGTASLTPEIEIEIRPKFAAEGDDWREDILFLALFTTFGHIDLIRTINAAATPRNTMADLIARILLGLIAQNSRKPLKTRRATTVHSFEPLLELDPEALLNPEDDGWPQPIYQMSLDNQWWATIYAGIRSILPSVRDARIGSSLQDIIARSGRPRSKPSSIRRLLPPRLSAWQLAYDLSYELMRGASMAPGVGRFTTFGFTIETWRTWEALLERSLVMAVGANRVVLQGPHAFGRAIKAGRSSPLEVFPDAVVADGKGHLIVDAKYKGRSDRGFVGISAPDRYEMLAFMHSVGTDRAILLYPSLRAATVGSLPEALEISEVPMGTIKAIAVGIRGIGKPTGLYKFVETIGLAIKP